MQEVLGMNGMRKQAVARVDEEDKKQSRDQQGAELADGANLRERVSRGLYMFDSSERDIQCGGSCLGASRHCDSTSSTVQYDLTKKQLWHQLTAANPELEPSDFPTRSPRSESG